MYAPNAPAYVPGPPLYAPPAYPPGGLFAAPPPPGLFAPPPIPAGSIAPFTAAQIVEANRIKRARVEPVIPDSEFMAEANRALDHNMRVIIDTCDMNLKQGRLNFLVVFDFHPNNELKALMKQPITLTRRITPDHFIRAIVARPQFVDYKIIYQPRFSFEFRLNHVEFCVLAVTPKLPEDLLRVVFECLVHNVK